jgi:transcriptional regulator with XRE-family HTH domain
LDPVPRADIVSAMLDSARPVGDLLREWRQRRRLSQLDLALEADISTKHLSFVETGRALPSRDMVIHLADRLEIPLRERNRLLVAAGYAPVFHERPLGDPALDAVRRAVDQVLAGHEPYPALAVDRHWTLIAANAAVAALLAGVAAPLLQPPVNVLRLSLHPEGLAPRIANLAQWRAHLLARLDRQIDLTADSALAALRDELAGYRLPPLSRPRAAERPAVSPVVPFELVTPAGTLAFVSTVTVFGTPIDVTVSELAVEAFFPADAATAERLRRSVG